PAFMKDTLGLEAAHDDDAVVIGHDHVAGLHALAGTDDRNIDRAERLLDGPLRGDRLRPDRELHLLEIAHIPHARLDDEAAHAARLERAGEQLTEIARVRG